jgi:hypothetical protein
MRTKKVREGLVPSRQEGITRLSHTRSGAFTAPHRGVKPLFKDQKTKVGLNPVGYGKKYRVAKPSWLRQGYKATI